DGFNVTRTVTPESYEDFIQYVIPELQRRGRFKTEYKQGSLRHKLIGKGERLPSSHPVQSFRC
ncbi:MAG TPA: LLM class flavin-dependent oxidoreductase, partial [Moraxellaceae bacterium]|nr:LLM class flavin-dependent oxidoreductase [Moraxellaceae bacterium]